MLRHVNKWMLKDKSAIEDGNKHQSLESYFQTIGKKKAVDFRRLETALNDNLIEAERCIYDDPANLTNNEELIKVKSTLRNLQNKRIQG